MAIYHCSISNYSRSKGQNACAHASYISGTKVYCSETEQTINYTRKSGVRHSEIILPENAPEEYAEREKLWNAVHAIEKSSDARLARDIEFALPNELPLKENIKIARSVAECLAGRGMCVDFAIHDPDKKVKNVHCHTMVTTRKIEPGGAWRSTEQKVYANDRDSFGKPIYNPNKSTELENRIPVIDKKTGQQKIGAKGRKLWERVSIENNDWNTREFVEEVRYMIQDKINEALEKNGLAERVDCRSLKEQGIDREPTIHEGATARKMEQRGEEAERCAINRDIKLQNEEHEKLLQELAFTTGMLHACRATMDIPEPTPEPTRTMAEDVYNAFKELIYVLRSHHLAMARNVELMKVSKKAYETAKKEFEKVQKEYDAVKFHVHGREDKRNLEYHRDIMLMKQEKWEADKTELQGQNRERAEYMRGILKDVTCPLDEELIKIHNVDDIPLICSAVAEWLEGFEVIRNQEQKLKEPEKAENKPIPEPQEKTKEKDASVRAKLRENQESIRKRENRKVRERDMPTKKKHRDRDDR